MEARFSHPKISKDLLLDIKPSSIVWAYGLNTQSYDTYGGEVVQILSMYIDDMTISGQTTSYSKMEEIYAWFVAYMQLATQSGKFQPDPVKFEYFHRAWEFQLSPKSLPGLKYGTNVVVPEWSVSCAVVETPVDLEGLIMSDVGFKATAEQGQFDPFGKATAEIGFDEDNPWSNPKAKGSPSQKTAFDSLANSFVDFLESWSNGENDYLAVDTSKPAWIDGKKSMKDEKETEKVAKDLQSAADVAKHVNDVLQNFIGG